ncbi:MAG: PASTA domain-containing protein [Calditrichaeota bacterium]|nr:PASTA domain-containing protein [Calditrichota bacterium]
MKRRRWQNRLDLIAGLVVVGVGSIWLLAFFDKIVMPLVTRAGAEVAVPNLRRLTYNEAEVLCRKAGLVIARTRDRFDDRIPPGSVVDQFPPAGSVVKPGRTIELVLAASRGMATVPELKGRSPREALLIADSSGLKVDLEHLRYRHSSSDPEGVIIDQKPLAGSDAERGSEVLLTVGLGAFPEHPIVPDLSGRSLPEVRFLLARYNLTAGTIARYPDRSRPPGTVIEQTPRAGSPLPEDGLVAIRIATPPVGGVPVTDTTRYGESINDTAVHPRERR